MIAGTDFRLVDIDRVWPRIWRRALRSRSALRMLREIRRQCRCGEAVCLEGSEGVVILRADGTEDGTIVVTVLLAVSTGLHGAFQRHEHAMLAIARDIGADSLLFRTDRARAWRRLLGAQWFEREPGTFVRST